MEAYFVTMKQFREALERATFWLNIYAACSQQWALNKANEEALEAELLLALAFHELETVS